MLYSWEDRYELQQEKIIRLEDEKEKLLEIIDIERYEKKELEYECELLELQIAKLKEEYVELKKENKELKDNIRGFKYKE